MIGFFNERRIREPLSKVTRGSSASQIYAGSILRNAQAIRSMGMLSSLRERWLAKQREFIANQTDASDTAGADAAFSKLVQSLLGSSLLGIGCWLTLQGKLGGAGMIVGSILGGKVLAPLVQIIANWRQVENAREALELPAPKGALSVEGLVAGAPGSHAQILRGIAFRVAPVDSLAVVGPSASGKTTLARLLSDPDQALVRRLVRTQRELLQSRQQILRLMQAQLAGMNDVRRYYHAQINSIAPQVRGPSNSPSNRLRSPSKVRGKALGQASEPTQRRSMPCKSFMIYDVVYRKPDTSLS